MVDEAFLPVNLFRRNFPLMDEKLCHYTFNYPSLPRIRHWAQPRSFRKDVGSSPELHSSGNYSDRSCLQGTWEVTYLMPGTSWSECQHLFYLVLPSCKNMLKLTSSQTYSQVPTHLAQGADSIISSCSCCKSKMSLGNNAAMEPGAYRILCKGKQPQGPAWDG